MKNNRLSVHMDAISDSVLGLCQFADYLTRDGHTTTAWHIRLIARHLDELVGMVRAELWCGESDTQYAPPQRSLGDVSISEG